MVKIVSFALAGVVLAGCALPPAPWRGSPYMRCNLFGCTVTQALQHTPRPAPEDDLSAAPKRE